MAATMLHSSLAARAAAAPRVRSAAAAVVPAAPAPRAADRALRAAFRAPVAGAELRRPGGARLQASRPVRVQAAASSDGSSTVLGVSTVTLKKARTRRGCHPPARPARRAAGRTVAARFRGRLPTRSGLFAFAFGAAFRAADAAHAYPLRCARRGCTSATRSAPLAGSSSSAL